MSIAKKFLLFFSIICAATAFISTGAQGVAGSSDILQVPEKEKDTTSVTLPSINSLNRKNGDDHLYHPQNDTTAKDSIPVVHADSLKTATDSVPPPKKSAIEARVDYQSEDSIVMTGRNMIFLYGQGDVKYQSMELTADYIQVNMDSSNVYATYSLDSIGDPVGYPVFKDGGSSYESKTMRYNFKTKKGYITDVITTQGEGYVTAGRTKKMTDDVLYMVDGKYTTCDNHDHPHFYLGLTKAKVRTGKNIVTGPAYLVIADVPLPIAIPFGFFPFTDSYSSGILMPTYGDEMTRGFYLRDGGYYFAFNDYIDLALTGEIYTKGSWGLAAQSKYRKRYRYNGNFNAGYLVTVTGDKGIDYQKSTDFKVNWSHSQDPKANPYQVLSASVNFSSSSYDRNQTSSMYNPNLYTTNSKGSSISYTQRFPESPWTLSANIMASQSTKDSTVAVTLPNLTINMSTVFPFRRKQVVGKERWYEKVSLSYSGVLQNSITTKEDLLFKSNLIKDWNNSFIHNIPVSATFNFLKYLNVTPSVSYKERWYTNRYLRDYDTEQKKVVNTDTIWGFNRVYDYGVSLGFNTKLYGFYKPWKVFGDKVQAIRHVFTPSISLSARPDFGSESYGYWREITYIDAQGRTQTEWVTPFQGKDVPGRGKSGALNFSVQNNLEMKVKSDSDSTGVKKISILDNLALSGSYNLMADSMKWSEFSLAVRLKLSKSFTFNINAILDPYTYRVDGKKQDIMRWQDGKGFARLKSTGTSFSYTFSNEVFKKFWGAITGEKAEESDATPTSTTDQAIEDIEEGDATTPQEQEKIGSLRQKKEETGEYDEFGYLKTTIPWSLSFNYGLNLTYDMANFNTEKREYPYTINQNLGFSGSLTPTPGWTFGFSTSWDFDSHKLVYMNCNIARNLHCWSMSAGFIPIGPYKSYNFTISVNSSLLHDLKYDQSSNYRDAMDWY